MFSNWKLVPNRKSIGELTCFPSDSSCILLYFGVECIIQTVHNIHTRIHEIPGKIVNPQVTRSGRDSERILVYFFIPPSIGGLEKYTSFVCLEVFPVQNVVFLAVELVQS